MECKAWCLLIRDWHTICVDHSSTLSALVVDRLSRSGTVATTVERRPGARHFPSDSTADETRSPAAAASAALWRHHSHFAGCIAQKKQVLMTSFSRKSRENPWKSVFSVTSAIPSQTVTCEALRCDATGPRAAIVINKRSGWIAARMLVGWMIRSMADAQCAGRRRPRARTVRSTIHTRPTSSVLVRPAVLLGRRQISLRSRPVTNFRWTSFSTPCCPRPEVCWRSSPPARRHTLPLAFFSRRSLKKGK